MTTMLVCPYCEVRNQENAGSCAMCGGPLGKARAVEVIEPPKYKPIPYDAIMFSHWSGGDDFGRIRRYGLKAWGITQTVDIDVFRLHREYLDISSMVAEIVRRLAVAWNVDPNELQVRQQTYNPDYLFVTNVKPLFASQGG